MPWILTLLYVYSLTLLTQVSADNTYCRFPDLRAFASPLHFPSINIDEFNANCLRYPSFNATIRQGSLHIEGCDNVEYQFGDSYQWELFTSPIPIPNGQPVRVQCSDGTSVFLVNPPVPQPQSNDIASSNPSVFIVMVDAVSFEALHRMMPNTVDMLKSETDLDVYEFTKYSTVGLNSNPNKFAMFGRHEYDRNMKTERPQLSWVWEYAKKLGYTTIIAEDECPRHDSVWDLMNVPTKGNKMNPTEGPDYVFLDQICVEDPHPNKYCVQNRWGFEYVVDYATGLVHNLEEQNSKKPVFMWSNFIDAHEPDQWAASLMDNTVVNYLSALSKSSFMDNGVIIFLSDHGIHFGDFAYSSVLGSAENKHPFLYVMAKKGLLNKDILLNNQDKLVTPNDIYRTISSLIGYTEVKDHRDVDILSSPISENRTCEMAGIPRDFCMCSYGPEQCKPQLPSHLWETCLSRYAHPRFFDWEYYAQSELKTRFNRDFDECEAMTHWCSSGLSLGLNGTSRSGLRDFVAAHPELANNEYCWNWPSDCNWGHVMEYYFAEGYLSDEQ